MKVLLGLTTGLILATGYRFLGVYFLLGVAGMVWVTILDLITKE